MKPTEFLGRAWFVLMLLALAALMFWTIRHELGQLVWYIRDSPAALR